MTGHDESITLLRAAANILRTRAYAATKGAWGIGNDERIATDTDAWIVLAQPALGAVLADWLDIEATVSSATVEKPIGCALDIAGHVITTDARTRAALNKTGAR